MMLKPRLSLALFGAFMAVTAPAALLRAQPEYTVDPIETPPNGFAVYPSAINNSGYVVGWWYGSPVTNRQPFLYSALSGYRVLPKPTGLQFSVPMDINDAGIIVGFACPTWSDTTNPRGWKLEGDIFTLLPAGSHAVGINSTGLIVGSTCVDVIDGSVNCLLTTTQPPEVETFPGVGGYSGSMDRPIVVNDSGQLAYRVNATTAVFRDTDGTTTSLPSPPAGWSGISVDGINNAGQVLARWTRSTSHPLRWYSRGFVWSPATGAQEFGISANSNRPKAINNHGQVIIESGSHDQAFFDTWLWSPEAGLINLDNRTDYGANLVLTDLYDINDAGQILAAGDTISPPADIYVILNPTTTPPPPCPADFDGDTVVNSQDFFAFLEAFFSQAPAADFNQDSTVNSQDFFEFLKAFFAECER